MIVIKIKETKGTNNCAIKQKLKFDVNTNCLDANQLENEIDYIKKLILKQIV